MTSGMKMPGAGLSSYETLHRSDAQASWHFNIERKTSIQLHRHEPRSSQDTTMLEDAADTYNRTATVFNYADYVFASNKRSTEAELFASLVWRTRQDLTEASRLYLSPTINTFLESWPDRKAWVDRVLSDIRAALVAIGAHIESVRSNRDDDETSGTTRKFEYTLSHQKRLSQKQQSLADSHQILLGAIQVMQTVEQCAGLVGSVPEPIFEAPVRPWLRSDGEIIRAPYSRRSSLKNLSALSVATSGSADKHEMNYREVPLVELPGSTPDDILISDIRGPPKCTRTQGSHSYNPTRVDSPTSAHVPLRQMNDLLQDEHRNTEPETSRISIPNPKNPQVGAVHDLVSHKSHASPTLNAVVDIIIERTQSIASTTASIRMPVLARRYRPRPVNVQNPHLRHRSLPSELPPHQSQPSLEDDLRDWMVQTAAGDPFPETDLTRSPTVSSTASIASRYEMMKILASIPSVDKDNQQLASTDSSARSFLVLQDDTSNCTILPSATNSPSMPLETTHVQESTTLLSDFPLPPSQPKSSQITPTPAPSHQDILLTRLLQGGTILKPPQVNNRTVASELPPIQEDMRSQDDFALAASLPLPRSQSNSPPMHPAILRKCQHTTLLQRSSTLTPKSLPSAARNNASARYPPEISPKSHQSEPVVSDSAEPISLPKQPQRPPPPPPLPTSTTPPIAASRFVDRGSPKAISDFATAAEDLQVQSSPRREPPPPVPFFDTTAQLSKPPQIPSTLQAVPSATAADTDSNTEVPKLKTAEAKRRAAHARRMKLAFGG